MTPEGCGREKGNRQWEMGIFPFLLCTEAQVGEAEEEFSFDPHPHLGHSREGTSQAVPTTA